MAAGFPLRSVVGAMLLLVAPFPGAAQQPIPIRTVKVLATSDSGLVANIYAVRAVGGNRVLVNDASRHRLLLLDSTLKQVRVLADTAGEAPNNFGTGNGGLLPFLGDTTLFIDWASQALVLIGPTGTFGRVMSLPKVSDLGTLSGAANGVPGFDAQGRMFYRGVLPQAQRPSFAGADTIYTAVDSAPVIRADMEMRRLDTVAKVRIPAQRYRLSRTETAIASSPVVHPLPLSDAWAFFEDGTVAIVRGQDYHIDWVHADGTRSSTGKMPFDWRRLEDSEKQRMVDSVQHTIDSLRSATVERVARASGRDREFAEEELKGFAWPLVVTAGEIPDYYPPVRYGSQVRADRRGNLWILPTTSTQAKGGALYDVVNRNGEIIERVQLPGGRTLAGFGAGDVVYLIVPFAVGGARLERARIVRR